MIVLNGRNVKTMQIVQVGENPSFHKFPIENDRVVRPSRQESINKILDWLQECEQDHPACRFNIFAEADTAENGSTSHPNLPTRVVDVGITGAPEYVRLYQTRGLHARYATLSHCWGKTIQCRTLRSNIGLHLEYIPWSALSSTFKDAIQITRDLGIRYLWIDALCIIQDDSADWEREAKLMAEYYGRSYCTIAASGAPDGSYGCWVQSIDGPVVTLPAGKTDNQPTSPMRYLCLAKTGHPAIQLPERNPLHSRGWALQERLLPRRTIFFTTEQIYFECREHLRTEDGRCYSVDDGQTNVYADMLELKRFKISGMCRKGCGCVFRASNPT